MAISSVLSFFGATSTIPTLPTLNLSDDENRIANGLANQLYTDRTYLELHELYYDGLQRMQDLGIAIPPSLNKLRTVIGWPRIGVDAISNRCRVEGFRYPGATDTDDDLQEIWQANNLDGESQLAHLDALIFGRCYIAVGPAGDGDTTNGEPVITAESPMNMTATWSPRTRQCTSALQLYVDVDFASDTFGQEVAVLYLPNKTITMARAAPNGINNQDFEITTDPDVHNLGQVPVVRMSNRQRVGNRAGKSEITPEWMNTTDSATRTLLGMEIGREFYSAPRRYILGASEDAFKKPDGTPVNAWDTYMGKFWALERDEDGNVPTVGEFKTGDPAVYTKMLDQYSKIMAGEMGVPPHFLGNYSDGNPASADAIRSGYEELTIRSRNKQTQFGQAWECVLRLALQIRGQGVPDGASRMETDWTDPAPTTPASTSAAIYQQVEGGMVPPTSSVVLKRLGYSAVERAQLAEDRDKDQGAAFLAELSHSLVAKAARVDQGLAADIAGHPIGVPVVTPPASVTAPKGTPPAAPATPPNG